MVLNGLEMASGSIRINRAELQTRVLDVIGIDPAEAEERFGFLLRALRFGAPPHGGIAPGIDRIAMQLGDTDNLREVVAFPKLGGGATRSPARPRRSPPSSWPSWGSRSCARRPVGSGRAHLRRSRGDDAGLRRGLDRDAALPARAFRQRLGAALGRSRGATRPERRARSGGRGAGSRGRRRRLHGRRFRGRQHRHPRPRCARPRAIVTTPLEHPAVSGAVESLERHGCEIATLPVDADGHVPVSAFDEAVQPGDLVCSLIWASNLTGVIQPVAQAAAICAERGVPLHLDAVQACPALEVDIGSLPGTVTAAVAGHKLGGPKGAGLLCGRGLATLQPVFFGGGQERALRPGTESVAQAAGLAAALAAARADRGRYDRYRAVRDEYEAAVAARMTGVSFVGARAERTPGHSLALLEGLHGHALVALLDEQGIAAAAGPACASAESSASPALTAMGVTPEGAMGALRLSFGMLSGAGHGLAAADAVASCAAQLRRASAVV